MPFSMATAPTAGRRWTEDRAMEVKVTKTVNIPISPWCGKCYRKEKDARGQDFCTLHNAYLSIHRGQFLKCRDCYMALYDALEREG